MIREYLFNMELIELHTIDLRLAHTRCKDIVQEKRLLISIQQRDIQDPLQLVHDDQNERPVLIDGFKRYRCAMKLGIKTAPAEYIGSGIVSGILILLRRHTSGSFSTFEQAALIEELHGNCSMSIYDIATSLERSPAWVSVRLGLFDELSPLVRNKIMTGAFPVRAYMYSIRGFTRVNKVSAQQVNTCVEALSGKNLSTRELSILSRAYFTGSEQLKQLITDGDVHKVLDMIKRKAGLSPSSTSIKDRSFVDDLKHLVQGMKRIITAAELPYRSDNAEFLNSINVWSAELKNILPSFQKVIREVYEKSRYADICGNPLPAGTEQKSNSTTAQN
jgi:hypothetical protein